jgi:hypothetical protein
MTEPMLPDLLRAVWEYPLFDALYGRRTRRFGLGFEMPNGPTPYKSERAPLPLTETEEALLVAAGVGFSGVALWDQNRPLLYRSPDARTFPSTSRGRRTALFFTNDDGVSAIDPDGGSTEQSRSAGERPDVLRLFHEQRKVLQPGRLAIPRRVPPMCGHNLWASNMPGSTLFMPVCDVSYALIGLIAQFVDTQLERFAAGHRGGVNIVDDRNGFRSAGTEAWLRSGFLDAADPLPLSVLERQACYFMFSEPAAICQNMFLATEAMGLGGWMHCGFLSREVFEVLGFRTVVPQCGVSLAHPVGLEGIFQAACPPWFPSMDAAVDAVLSPLSSPATATGPVPHLVSEATHRAAAVTISDEGIACTKAVCNYIHDTYGRFPGGVDAMHLMWFMQVHHLDTGFYDSCFRSGTYGRAHADHLSNWHAEPPAAQRR